MLTLKLKAHEERRLRAGHLWAYSNELETDAGWKNITPGTLCRLNDSRGQPLGIGYVNSKTLLALRLLTTNNNAEIDADWFRRRIQSALALREKLYAQPYYRLIYGESDGLPGLVVDRYGDVLVVQITTAGMELQKALILEALQSTLKPRGLVLRNDTSMRETEGLPAYVEDVGKVPDSVQIEEGGVRFDIAMKGGQKTGWFYDQRDNRDRLVRYAKGARVLDVFSYVGGWALRASKFGASSVTCIDSSAPALEAAHHNATLNGVTLETIKDEALAAMKNLRGENRQFDLVIVDPPALIKRKKDEKAGQEHYAALNRQALQLLSADGLLVSCSCSHHMDAETLQRILLRESRTTRRRLQILEQGAQGPDHPVHPAIAETRYLKAFYCRASQ